jgi:hypothetical protein
VNFVGLGCWIWLPRATIRWCGARRGLCTLIPHPMHHPSSSPTCLGARVSPDRVSHRQDAGNGSVRWTTVSRLFKFRQRRGTLSSEKSHISHVSSCTRWNFSCVVTPCLFRPHIANASCPVGSRCPCFVCGFCFSSHASEEYCLLRGARGSYKPEGSRDQRRSLNFSSIYLILPGPWGLLSL